MTSAELAARAGTAERYTREWLEQQATAGFLDVDDATASSSQRRYSLPAEFGEIFVDPDSPIHLAPFAELIGILAAHVPDVVDVFRSGAGLAYDRFGLESRRVQERVNRPLYTTLLPNVWLPLLPDIHTRLQQSNPARVADIGCGAGWASIAIAQAYPNVIVDGFDNDGPSIAMALANAAAAGVADRVHFHVHDVAEPIAGSFDLVAAFMMLHDANRPVETLRVMRVAAGQDGTAIVMDTRVADEFVAPGGPVDRFSYVFSLLYCLPLGIAEQPSAGTDTVMRIDTLRGYARAAGFDQVSVLPIEHDFFRFYRLTARPGTAD